MVYNAMKINKLILSLTSLCALCFSQASGPGEGFPWAAQNGAWCWYQDPRAIYTYSGMIR
jgi:hypothetical protein